MTQNEIKEIERVMGKPILKIGELEIPTYIRNRDGIEQEQEVDHNARRNRLNKEREEREREN